LIGLADINDLDTLHEHSLIPIQTLVEVGFDSPYYHDPNMIYTFYAESWALVHYLMFQDARHGTHLLPEYAQQVTQGGDPLKAFVKIFGSTKHMDNILTPYISRMTYTALRYPITEKLSSKNFAVRPLSVVEADSDQAEFLLTEYGRVRATKLLDRALKEDPQSAKANALMSFLLRQEGESGKAAEQAQKAIQLDPNDYRGYLYAAIAIQDDHLSAARTAEVERDLTRALALKPDLAVADDMLAKVEMNQPGKLDQALAWASRAVQADPENNDYLIDMEMILLKQDHLAAAVAIEMRMLGRAGTPKKQAAVRNEIGWQLLQQNIAMPRADFEIKKANQLAPKNGDIVDSLGHLLEKEGNLPQAEEAYRHALDLQPKLVSSLRGLGDVLRKEHHLDQAIAQYHKALVIVPKDALVHYDLSLALKAKGDAAGAAKEQSAARKLDPFNTKYQ
jgi:tetratricopeptide (TPR) repeat protein